MFLQQPNANNVCPNTTSHSQNIHRNLITVITMQTLQINQQTLQIFQEFYKTIAWRPAHIQLESFCLNHSQLLLFSASSDNFFTVQRFYHKHRE